MTPHELLNTLRQAGVQVMLAGDGIDLMPAELVPTELVPMLRTYKPELRAILAAEEGEQIATAASTAPWWPGSDPAPMRLACRVVDGIAWSHFTYPDGRRSAWGLDLATGRLVQPPGEA